MKPLFCDLLQVEAIAPFRALDKLVKRGISVYDVQKIGPTCLKFCVKSKETEKVFAIFRGSCYTVTKIGGVRLKRAADALLRRPGIAAGILLSFALCIAGNLFVLDIRVEGSGARYGERAVEILRESGVSLFAPYRGENASAARAELLSLPGIVFAEVDKSGCVVTVTLEESEETPLPARENVLKASSAGVVEDITVLRGTALVKAGDTVEEGQTLVGGFFETEAGERKETFAVARASILHSYTGEFASDEESEDALRRAVASANMIAGGEPVDYTYTVREDGGIFIYTVAVRVRITCSVNM